MTIGCATQRNLTDLRMDVIQLQQQQNDLKSDMLETWRETNLISVDEYNILLNMQFDSSTEKIKELRRKLIN